MTASLVLAGCDGDAGPSPEPTPDAPVSKARLTFGVWGTEDELASYESMVEQFNETSETSRVVVEPYPDRDALAAALTDEDERPDVFLASRSELAWLREENLNVPVDELLDERGVAFGDRYSRAALEAFSADRRLQCMPYGISPMVMFYNTELVDFDRMAERGLDVPTEERTRWTFDQFEEAARFATRKRRGIKGVHVDPTLRSLAPFIYSGGGSLFNDAEDPTSLTLADDDSREALARTLEVLRDPTVTLSEEQLARRTPLEWFERGRVGMIEGYRSMVPRLRSVPGLEFDVIAMPILDSAATTGDITGTCIAEGAENIPAAADFLVHALSSEAVSEVARAGYLVPANQDVALTDDFLQPGREPEHASVFTSSVAAMRIPPLIDVWTELDAAVEPTLEEMFTVPVLDDLEEITTRIDEISRTVLDPPDPTDAPSDGSSDDSSDDAEE
ncbi:ABC transporter substrate-binding protein [Nocardioides dongkuii]|uniref:ABC transporter substrate-binding protein n=1 Tax=Nocardioides dongkuii TaxID=2760089 RepID=UPI001877F459|nr:extracellular solute-binding protein [Nocardioides dongkuii]